jgi:serine/threonine protein kinase
MAPEQFVGGTIDARTDQFSFAVALYEALYGERPFDGTTVEELAKNVTSASFRAVPSRPEVPAALRKVLVRSLSAAPEHRYPSMDQMLAALRAAQREPSVAPAVSSRGLRVGPSTLLGGAAVVGILAVFTWQSRRPAAAPAVIEVTPAHANTEPQTLPVSTPNPPSPASAATLNAPVPLSNSASPITPTNRDAKKRGATAPLRVPPGAARSKATPQQPYDDMPMEPSFARKAL